MGNQVDEAMARIAQDQGAEAIQKLQAAAGITKVRAKTHGDFASVARCAQSMRNFARDNMDKGHLSYQQQEALDMIFLKLARIMRGDPNEKDHWDDIAGYAYLGSQRLPG
jgi:hypothetical protein